MSRGSIPEWTSAVSSASTPVATCTVIQFASDPKRTRERGERRSTYARFATTSAIDPTPSHSPSPSPGRRRSCFGDAARSNVGRR
ncbi:MAG: hypothetical protein R3F34_03560 [Planctomycetota bacterium]